MRLVDGMRESAARNRAGRLGLMLRKSPGKAWAADNRREYQLLNARTGSIVLGARFETTLGKVNVFLDEYEGRGAALASAVAPADVSPSGRRLIVRTASLPR